MLSNCHEKYNQTQAQSGKKKKPQKNNGVIDNHVIEALSAKQKTTLIVDAMRELRSALDTSEISLGEKI